MATLEGHTSFVLCLTVYKNKLFSGSRDHTIRVWDADTHAHVATLEGHTDDVTCLTIYKNKQQYSRMVCRRIMLCSLHRIMTREPP